MRLLFITTFILLTSIVLAQSPDIESRFQEIDKAIAESPHYIAQREAQITIARHTYEQVTGKQKYDAGFKLYELYRPFVSDSAIYFLRQCISLAFCIFLVVSSDEHLFMWLSATCMSSLEKHLFRSSAYFWFGLFLGG